MSFVTRNPFERVDKLKVSEVESLVLDFTDSEIKRFLGHDPLLKNYVLNIWEKVNNKTVLETYPWNLLINPVDFCNAKCGFCMSWIKKDGFIKLGDLPKFDTLFSHARVLTLSGGEPTTHPNFGELIQYIANKIDHQHCYFSFITNGYRVDRYYDQLKDINIGAAFSLNAATAETHHQVMKLPPGSFSRITDSIRFFRSHNRYVNATMVVTSQNLVEIPAFIDLCHDLDVNLICFHTVKSDTGSFPMPDNSGSFSPPYLHPDFPKLVAEASKAIERSTIKVCATPDQWGNEVSLFTGQSTVDAKVAIDEFRRLHMKPIMTCGEPMSDEECRADPHNYDLGDPYNRVAPFPCNFVYHAIGCFHSDLAISPCCHMEKIPGYKKVGFRASEDFFLLWNSPAYVALRRSLWEGPLFPKCKVCTYQTAPGTGI